MAPFSFVICLGHLRTSLGLSREPRGLNRDRRSASPNFVHYGLLEAIVI
jgi:hypothetical protein